MRKADIRVTSMHCKRLFRESFRGLILVVSVALCGATGALRAQVGATFETLEVGGVDYQSVKVMSVSPSSFTIRHRGGIVQLPLRALSPELQGRFGYDSDAEAFDQLMLESEHKRQLERAEAEARKRADAPTQDKRQADTPVGRALARFGTVAPMRPVDLRPKFRELELGTKNQGRRPSCAVFAVASALEYQNAVAGGRVEKLSEEYLIWATRRTLGIPAGEKRTNVDEGQSGDQDAGFSLQEVLSAVRAYGIPLQSEMPNTFGMGMEKIPDPGIDLIGSARGRRQLSTFVVPGMNNDVKIANIMHVLNEGAPVVVGLRWPHWRSLYPAPLLSQQTPMEGRSHAVTIVGYYSENGQPDGLRFIFKNSWGIRWGTGGYGFAEIGYLRRNLLDAVVLEMRPAGS